MMNTPQGAEQHQQLVAVEKASLRARDLTQQLLTFSRGGTPVKRCVDVSLRIRDSTDFSVQGSSVRAKVEIENNLWPALADEGQIGQVIENLVINAVQAMPDDGIIWVKAENFLVETSRSLPLATGRYIRVRVEDQGEGIETQNLEQIFDPYFTTKETGNGLGLAICFTIVKKHNGYIGVSSEIGHGTVFDVYLPAAAQDVIESKDVIPADTGTNKSGNRILVMDGDRVVRQLLQSMLEILEYRVSCAQDGEEAIALYQKAMETGNGFRAVFFALSVPGAMGGEEAVQRLRTLDPSLTAIVSSGDSGHAVMSNYRDHGFDAVVRKPFRLQDLSSVLQGLLTGDTV